MKLNQIADLCDSPSIEDFRQHAADSGWTILREREIRFTDGTTAIQPVVEFEGHSYVFPPTSEAALIRQSGRISRYALVRLH